MPNNQENETNEQQDKHNVNPIIWSKYKIIMLTEFPPKMHNINSKWSKSINQNDMHVKWRDLHLYGL